MMQPPSGDYEPAGTVVVCDSSRIDADTDAVDRLCRLALAVRRRQGELRLWRPSPALVELIEAMGLAGVLRE